MNSIESPALRLSVVVPESAAWHHHPVYTEIVHRAHAAGLAGATVIRGIEGFGASRHIHTMRILSLAEDIPVLVLIIDEETKIRAFLPELDELVSRGIVVLDGVEVIRYVGEPGASE